MHIYNLEGYGYIKLFQNPTAKQRETAFHRISMVTTENLFSCFQSNQLQLIVALGLIYGAVQFYWSLNCSTESKCNINTRGNIFYKRSDKVCRLLFGKCNSRIWEKNTISLNCFLMSIKLYNCFFSLHLKETSPGCFGLLLVVNADITRGKVFCLDHIYLGGMFALSWCSGSLPI